MGIIEKELAEKSNNYGKFLNLTKRGYEFRKYYTDKNTGFTYLGNAIKEENMNGVKYRTFKGKTICNTMKEYNNQFI